jgi:hypothetical protein
MKLAVDGADKRPASKQGSTSKLYKVKKGVAIKGGSGSNIELTTVHNQTLDLDDETDRLDHTRVNNAARSRVSVMNAETVNNPPVNLLSCSTLGEGKDKIITVSNSRGRELNPAKEEERQFAARSRVSIMNAETVNNPLLNYETEGTGQGCKAEFPITSQDFFKEEETRTKGEHLQERNHSVKPLGPSAASLAEMAVVESAAKAANTELDSKAENVAEAVSTQVEAAEETLTALQEQLEAAAQTNEGGESVGLEALETNGEKMFHLFVHLILASWALRKYTSLMPNNSMLSCQVAFIASAPLYKPFAVSMWVVLMACCSYCHWALRRGYSPKDLAGIQPGEEPFHGGWFFFCCLCFTTLLFTAWMVCASPLVPLAVAFLPVTLFFVVLVPFSVIGLPLLTIAAVKQWAMGSRSQEDQEEGTDYNNAEQQQAFSLLLLKVTTAQVISTLVAMTWFIGFYTNEDTWSGYMSKIASELYVGINFFTMDFYISLEWPDLDLSFTLPLMVSLGALAFQYGLLLFKWLDQRKGFFEWGSGDDSTTRRSWVPFAFQSGKEGQTELHRGHPGTWLIYTLSFGTLSVSYGLEKLMMLLLPIIYKIRVWLLKSRNIQKFVSWLASEKPSHINLLCNTAADRLDTRSHPHVQDALVVQTVKNNPGLTVLDLSHCPNLSGLGLKQVLELAQHLVSLDISSCMLGAAGSEKIVAEAIKVTTNAIASVVLVPFSWLNCCCLLLSTG